MTQSQCLLLLGFIAGAVWASSDSASSGEDYYEVSIGEFGKRGKELLGKRRMDEYRLMPNEKRGRELFGKRSLHYVAPRSQVKRGRELFGKRSGSPTLTAYGYDMKKQSNLERSLEDEKELLESLLSSMRRERRGKVRELLG